MIFRIFVAIYCILAVVQAAEEKCKATQYAVDIYTKCVNDGAGTSEMQIIFCLLKELNIMDDSYKVNQQATMDSLKMLYDTDDVTMEKITKAYEVCFVGFQGNAEESGEVLKCTDLMKKLVCGEQLPCNNDNKPKHKEKCKPSAKAIEYSVKCLEDAEISNWEDQNEFKDKALPFFVCLLKDTGMMDDGYILNEAKTMEALDTLIVTDPNTLEKLKQAYSACFVGFQGTEEETEKILKCVEKMKNWACGKQGKLGECEAEAEEGYYCNINTNLLTESVLACAPQQADDDNAAYTDEEKMAAIKENKDEVLKCVLNAEGMIDADGNPLKQGFYDYFGKIVDTDVNTEALFRYEIDQCFGKYENADPSKIETENLEGLFECTMNFFRKICKQVNGGDL